MERQEYCNSCNTKFPVLSRGPIYFKVDTVYKNSYELTLLNVFKILSLDTNVTSGSCVCQKCMQLALKAYRHRLHAADAEEELRNRQGILRPVVVTIPESHENMQVDTQEQALSCLDLRPATQVEVQDLTSHDHDYTVGDPTDDRIASQAVDSTLELQPVKRRKRCDHSYATDWIKVETSEELDQSEKGNETRDTELVTKVVVFQRYADKGIQTENTDNSRQQIHRVPFQVKRKPTTKKGRRKSSKLRELEKMDAFMDRVKLHLKHRHWNRMYWFLYGYKKKPFTRWLHKVFLKLVKTEIKDYCKSSPMPGKMATLETLQDWSWEKMSEEIGKYMPLTNTLLEELVWEKRQVQKLDTPQRIDVQRAVGTLICIGLYHRNKKFRCFQSLSAIQLWRCGGNPKIMGTFQHLGFTVGSNGRLALVKRFIQENNASSKDTESPEESVEGDDGCRQENLQDVSPNQEEIPGKPQPHPSNNTKNKKLQYGNLAGNQILTILDTVGNVSYTFDKAFEDISGYKHRGGIDLEKNWGAAKKKEAETMNSCITENKENSTITEDHSDGTRGYSDSGDDISDATDGEETESEYEEVIYEIQAPTSELYEAVTTLESENHILKLV